MCTDQQHEDLLGVLKKIHHQVQRRDQLFQSLPISDALSMVVDYQDRRYLYIRSAVDLTLSTGNTSTATFHLPASIWYQINFRPGTQLVTSGFGTTSTIIGVCATDDLIDYQPPYSSNTATLTSVASANSDTLLLAANAARKEAYFFNDSSAVLFLSLGTTAASSSSYTNQIAAGAFFALPTAPLYTGMIRGIWASANGNARITELS